MKRKSTQQVPDKKAKLSPDYIWLHGGIRQAVPLFLVVSVERARGFKRTIFKSLERFDERTTTPWVFHDLPGYIEPLEETHQLQDSEPILSFPIQWTSLAGANTWAVFAMNRGELIGFARGETNPDLSSEIEEVEILEPYRGRGLCPSLLREVSCFLDTQRMQTIELYNVAQKAGEVCYIKGLSPRYKFTCRDAKDVLEGGCLHMHFDRLKAHDQDVSRDEKCLAQDQLWDPPRMVTWSESEQPLANYVSFPPYKFLWVDHFSSDTLWGVPVINIPLEFLQAMQEETLFAKSFESKYRDIYQIAPREWSTERPLFFLRQGRYLSRGLNESSQYLADHFSWEQLRQPNSWMSLCIRGKSIIMARAGVKHMSRVYSWDASNQKVSEFIAFTRRHLRNGSKRSNERPMK